MSRLVGRSNPTVRERSQSGKQTRRYELNSLQYFTNNQHRGETERRDKKDAERPNGPLICPTRAQGIFLGIFSNYTSIGGRPRLAPVLSILQTTHQFLMKLGTHEQFTKIHNIPESHTHRINSRSSMKHYHNNDSPPEECHHLGTSS